MANPRRGDLEERPKELSLKRFLEAFLKACSQDSTFFIFSKKALACRCYKVNCTAAFRKAVLSFSLQSPRRTRLEWIAQVGGEASTYTCHS